MKVFMGIAAIAMLLILLATPVFAVHGGAIVIGNEFVMRIRHADSGMTPDQRADEVVPRLNKVLGCPCFVPSDVRVVRKGGVSCIMYGKDLIVSVDKATAADNGMSSRQLAKLWASNLRRVIPKAKASNCGPFCTIKT